MQEKTEIKYYITLVFAVTLLIYNVSCNLIPKGDILSVYEYPDISNPCEYSDCFCPEDDFICSEAEIAGYRVPIRKNPGSFDNPIWKFHFQSQIWEPPKFS